MLTLRDINRALDRLGVEAFIPRAARRADLVAHAAVFAIGATSVTVRQSYTMLIAPQDSLAREPIRDSGRGCVRTVSGSDALRLLPPTGIPLATTKQPTNALRALAASIGRWRLRRVAKRRILQLIESAGRFPCWWRAPRPPP